ncbi:MAG: protoheme IX farnesyltransferase [Acidimicrobiales bacterium]
MLTATKTRSRASAFVALTKPRIIELLLVSTVPTMVLAHRGLPSVWLMVATVIGGTLSAGGANAFNMYVDRDIDAVMERTKGRPLVTGEVAPTEALVFAFVVESVSFFWLWAFVNLLSAVLAVAACAFYVFVYTLWLKRTSTQNIVIGGAAGAAPVLIGWSAVTNSLAWPALILFGVVFFWTPPHFWALAIRYEDDYASVDVPMMPVVAGHRSTARQILAYSIVVWLVTLLLIPVGDMGWIYTIAAMVLGAFFTGGAVQLLLESDSESLDKRAIRYFAFSITHLTLLFAAVAVDQLVRWGI